AGTAPAGRHHRGYGQPPADASNITSTAGAARACCRPGRCAATGATAGQRKDTTAMTRPRQPDPSPQPGTRPPEYVIELWVSPQLTQRTRRAVTPMRARRRPPAGEPRPQEPDAHQTPGP